MVGDYSEFGRIIFRTIRLDHLLYNTFQNHQGTVESSTTYYNCSARIRQSDATSLIRD